MKTTNFLTISTSDQIMAQLEINGRVLVRLSRNNFSSIDEVVGLAYALAGRFMGLARLTIRNKSQGWSQVMSLATRRGSAPTRHAPAPLLQGQQYLIPFAV